MKKLLLCMVAIVAAINLSAKDDDESMGKWQALFEPVAAADDMGNIQMAQGGEGSVYVSSKCSKAFTFGITSVAPEISGSSVIVKYDGEGKQQGAMTFEGAVDITAMTADADGNLYAAGRFLEGMTITNAFGTQTVVAGNETNYCAFIVKVSAQGLLAALRVLQPTPDTDVTENDEAGYFYCSIDPLTITPNKIQLDGDKVYVSAKYYGNVEDLGWKGAYAQSWGMAFDVASYGVFSLSKSDLSAPKSEANFRQTDVAEGVTEAMCEPEAFSFVVTNGIVSIAAFCYGDVTLSTPIGNRNFSYARATDESGKKTHALVMVSIAGTLLVKEYPSAVMHANEALGLYGIMGIEVNGTTAYLGGTCYGSFPLDAETSYDHTYAFLSAFDMTSGNMLWASGMPYESKGITMIVTDDEIHAVTTLGTADFDLSSQEVELNDEMKLDAAASYGDSYVSVAMVNETYVGVIAIDMDGGNGGGGDNPGGNGLPGFWQKSFEPFPTDQYSDLKNLHTATALDGAVYATATYNKTMIVAGKQLPDTEGMVSTMIVRYSKDGQEEWGAAIVGAADVTAMTADYDGTLYVAGTFKDAVECTAPDGTVTTLKAEEGVVPGFVAKISADGKFEKVQVFTPSAREDILESDMYWPTYNPTLAPTKIQLDGDKVYVAASFMGEVADLNWKGVYVNAWGFMYDNVPSRGIFSLNKSDLGNATSVAVVQATTSVLEDVTYCPETLNFQAEHGKVHLAFIGWGSLKVSTPVGISLFPFETGEADSGMREHGLGIAHVTEILETEAIHVAMNDNSYPNYNIKNLVAPEHDGTIYIGGTFYGNYWFDTSITTDYNTAFVVAFNEGEPQWSVVSPDESEGISLLAGEVNGTKGVLASTIAGTQLIDTNGKVSTLWSSETVYDEFAQYYSASASYIYANEGRVYVGGYFNGEEAYQEAERIKTSVKDIIAGAQKTKNNAVYNLAGQQVKKGYKGVVITSDGVKQYWK